MAHTERLARLIDRLAMLFMIWVVRNNNGVVRGKMFSAVHNKMGLAKAKLLLICCC